jgi:hypothetical protein
MSVPLCAGTKDCFFQNASEPGCIREQANNLHRRSSLILFQSLEEYSATVEPTCKLSFKGSPCSDESGHGQFLPRSVSDIWSADSCSTGDSTVRDSVAATEFSDYSHIFSESRHDYSDAPRNLASGPSNHSVVLRLSSLIF